MAEIVYTATEEGLAIMVDGKQVGPCFVQRHLNTGDVVRWLRNGGLTDILALNQVGEG